MALLNAVAVAALSFIITGGFVAAPALPDKDDTAVEPALPPGALPPDLEEDIDHYFLSIPPAERQLLDKCTDRMSQRFADEIADGMLSEAHPFGLVVPYIRNIPRIANVTDKCCRVLAKMGRRCHVHLVRLLVRFPVFKSNEKLIQGNAGKLWNHCALVAARPEPPAPSPFSV